MPVAEIGDPRLQSLFGGTDPRDAGVAPVVRLPRKGFPSIAIAIIAVVAGLLLFLVLDTRRTTATQPAVTAPIATERSAWAAPPPLYVPPDLDRAPQPNIAAPQPLSTRQVTRVTSVAPALPLPQRRAEPAPVPAIPQPYIAPPVPTMPQPRTSSGSPLVIDNSTAAGPASPGLSSPPGGTESTRVRASALANRSMTVVQGTVVQAVLETALNSTAPGEARAVVSRDVRSFDGTNILIPRGSKLIGEYKSDVTQGQKRAVITWVRLIRPDGMTIAIDSPAVDPLGRGGVAAKVHSHFLARLGDALLQTTIGIGTSLAQRRIAAPVVVLPQAAAGAAVQGPKAYVPTLTVPPGKSVSVFVAHDLDFTAGGTSE